jgi:hypothetical protein
MSYLFARACQKQISFRCSRDKPINQRHKSQIDDKNTHAAHIQGAETAAEVNASVCSAAAAASSADNKWKS